MEAKEGLELIKLVIDETVTQLGADPLIKISAQLAATKMLKISFKAGGREVVEWVKKECNTAYIYEGEYTYDTNCDNQVLLDLGDWQAQLKDWFKDNPELLKEWGIEL